MNSSIEKTHNSTLYTTIDGKSLSISSDFVSSILIGSFLIWDDIGLIIGGCVVVLLLELRCD